MQQPSGMANAGRILLLVGAILAVAGALVLVLLAVFFFVMDSGFLGDDEPTFLGAFLGLFYLGLGLVQAVGGVFGFIAYSKAQKGDWHGAWVFGLVAALVPPLQIIPLLGAIFCLVSPEGEAARRGR